MRKWPSWFPLPNAWMSAVFLLLLVTGLNVFYKVIFSLQPVLALISFVLTRHPISSFSVESAQGESARYLLRHVSSWGSAGAPILSFLILAVVVIPFVAIAYAHHILHIGLDRMAPVAADADVTPTRGFFPGMMSWWEALYGWTTIQLSSLLSFAILVLFATRTAIPSLYPYASGNGTGALLTSLVGYALWISIAAYLYQFEYAFRQRLMASGRDR